VHVKLDPVVDAIKLDRFANGRIDYMGMAKNDRRVSADAVDVIKHPRLLASPLGSQCCRARKH
jgi:hypothetical protein